MNHGAASEREGRHAAPRAAEDWLRAVQDIRSTLGETEATRLISDFRPVIPTLIAALVDRITSDVDAYSTEPGRRRHQLVTMASTAAVTHFVESLEGKASSLRRVDELFLRMGYGEAHDGNDLSAMHEALRVATRDTWDQMRAFAAHRDLSSAILGQLGSALFGYLDHLAEQTERGFDSARRASGADALIARTRLTDRLLAGADADDIRPDADAAVWSVPTQLVVLAVRDLDADQPPDLSDLPPAALSTIGQSPAVVICDAADTDAILDHLRATLPQGRIARSWPVRINDVRDAHRWTHRALGLVDAGVITAAPVIDCAQHRTQLWLHAEPAIRRRLTQDLLRPLLAETPNSREILSETLLVWLETRDSAPAIAGRLGIHPQTVRYRWKRINELFGEQLHDPELVIQLTMLLKASVPLWRAGDQSDFQRYASEEAPR